ncbi:MAG: hypothetical protein ACW972_09245 [Promethearchaeota archaeon]|jgi:hypothetical protein
MAEGKIIADGPTQEILNNKVLVEGTSLVLPQSKQLSSALQAAGFQNTDTLLSKSDATKYLIQLLKNTNRSS